MKKTSSDFNPLPRPTELTVWYQKMYFPKSRSNYEACGLDCQGLENAGTPDNIFCLEIRLKNVSVIQMTLCVDVKLIGEFSESE